MGQIMMNAVRISMFPMEYYKAGGSWAIFGEVGAHFCGLCCQTHLQMCFQCSLHFLDGGNNSCQCNDKVCYFRNSLQRHMKGMPAIRLFRTLPERVKWSVAAREDYSDVKRFFHKHVLDIDGRRGLGMGQSKVAHFMALMLTLMESMDMVGKRVLAWVIQEWGKFGTAI